jgi:hypothetical protein
MVLRNDDERRRDTKPVISVLVPVILFPAQVELNALRAPPALLEK